MDVRVLEELAPYGEQRTVEAQLAPVVALAERLDQPSGLAGGEAEADRVVGLDPPGGLLGGERQRFLPFFFVALPRPVAALARWAAAPAAFFAVVPTDLASLVTFDAVLFAEARVSLAPLLALLALRVAAAFFAALLRWAFV